MDEYQKDEVISQSYPVIENSCDKENKSEAPFAETRDEKPDFSSAEKTVIIQNDELTQDDTSDEGWQEAVPKGRSPAARKSSGSSRRPSLAKLNTNSMNVSQSSSRYRAKPTGFVSPRTSPSESFTTPTPTGSPLPVTKKFVKSTSFSPKQNTPTTPGSNTKSAPASPAAIDQVSKSAAPLAGTISVQAAGKLFSYKEVALAPPGTIVKAVAEQLPKENVNPEQNPQVDKETSVVETAQAKEEEEVQKQTGEKKLPVSEQEVEGGVANKKKQVVDSSWTASSEKIESAATATEEKEVETKRVEVECAVVKEGNNLNTTDSHPASPDSEPQAISTDNTTGLLEKENSPPKEEVSGGEDSPHDPVLPNVDGSSRPSSTEGEKQDEADAGKETRKLSAAAPPFNPSTIPVFGSVPVPGFKEHGGILPPPVNIPPMLTINPVRRSPHQSATARVPYGPRLSGGYNRYGSRVPRNKPGYHNPDNNGEVSPLASPTVMNPHAAEFVPGQPWVPNGYPMPPNGYLASPTGYLASPNGIPVSPTGFPISPNGIPLSPNGFPPSLNGVMMIPNEYPTSPVDSIGSPTVEIGSEDKSEVPEEGNTFKASTEVGDTTDQPSEDQSGAKEQIGPEIEVKKPVEAGATAKENCDSKEMVKDKKPSKCWGDYSDSEADIVEVTS